MNPMSDSTPKLDARIGTVVAGRYRIQKQLGEGGIGTVYRAEDEVLRTRVAIKLLKEDYARDTTILARFDREAKAMLALSHENIVHALNFGRTAQGDIVLVMELVEGETLRSALNRLKPFPVMGAVMIASQIGAALAKAHSMGVVHRDLKPENVMVAWTAEGTPKIKVLDFGMAKLIGETFGSVEVLTRKGAVFGTPEYMSPEQAMGQPVDAHADEYALGVMLFEMLVGKRPFSAPTPLDMLQLQIHTPPPSAHEANANVPLEVAQVVQRMMAKKRAERFADVASAMAALQSAATSAHRPSIPERASQPQQAAMDTGQRKWWQVLTGPKK